MGDVLDRWRINEGKAPFDNDTQNISIQSWVYSLERDGIPFRLYNELYERAMRTRAAAMKNGDFVPQFGVEIMLAEWPALERELRQREVDSGRMLTEHAATDCPHCFGSGMRYRFDVDGAALGVSDQVCDHTGPVQGKVLGKNEDVEKREITAEEFAAMHEGVKAAAVKQTQVKGESAEDICRRLADALWHEAADSPVGPERDELGLAWLRMLRAARYCREMAKLEG